MPVVLYRRQREIFEFIKEFIKTNSYSPTINEICDKVGLTSPATVFEHLVSLERKGMIRRKAGAARSIELLDPKYFDSRDDPENLPLLGFIAAGKPLEPFTDPHATFRIPSNLISPGKTCFVLQVKGDSMIEDGINSDDYVVVIKQSDAKDGDIVVALLESGLATLKRFFKELDRIRLEPANAKMAPIYATDVRIQGKVTALIRRYN
ncbi:MAG: transcriptional repressor LexA [bacterium]|nr:transcriptional repressor LexA [bacterium]